MFVHDACVKCINLIGFSSKNTGNRFGKNRTFPFNDESTVVECNTHTTIPFLYSVLIRCVVFFSAVFPSRVYFCYILIFLFIFSLACPQKCQTEHIFHNQFNDQHERNCVVVRFSFIKIIVYIVCMLSHNIKKTTYILLCKRSSQFKILA